MSVEILKTAAQLYIKMASEMAFNVPPTFKVTQGHWKWRNSTGHYITSHQWSVLTTSLSYTISEFYSGHKCL